MVADYNNRIGEGLPVRCHVQAGLPTNCGVRRRSKHPPVTGPMISGTAIVLIALCGATHASASLADAPAEMREAVEDNATGFLNDLSARRRTTTLFPNPQPVFAGVQESFVNTSTGSMTFLVRDLVRVGGMPIVMGRVYDSTVEEGGDFGPGWKLTVIVRPGKLKTIKL